MRGFDRMRCDRLRLGRFVFIVFLMALAGCESLFGDSESEKEKVAGERIAVMQASRKLAPDSEVSDVKPVMPPTVANRDWPQAGGNAEHSLIHAELASQPEEIWRADIGRGSGGYYKLLSLPVVSGGRVFTLDARGLVTAFSAADGERLWEFDTTPPESDDRAMSGGICAAGGALYVTTGFGEVVSLKAKDGSLTWRKTVGKPFRAAPTVAEDRVFVVGIDNELTALASKTGEKLWHHNGIAESATLMGASSPAAMGDSVVVAYSSGEIFNLRAQNGRMAWTDVLAVPELVGALPAIADIRGLPVIDRGRVYAISHSGRMAAIDQRTGDRVWEADVGGINTPLIAGDTVFVLSNDNELIALTRERGRIIWIKSLQKLEDPEDRDSTPVFWWGPLLAGGKLWLTNSLGHLGSFNPENGDFLYDAEVSKAFYIPPIAAGGTVFVLSDDGQLTALK